MTTTRVTARLGLALGTVGLLLAGPAVAEEGVAFKNLMGTIGILPKEKDAIAYRERAPLVVPPRESLPTPSASAGVSDPNWPSDPDVAAARRRRADERLPVTFSETRRSQERNDRLTPAELGAGRVAASQGHAPRDSYGDSNSARPISPDELRAKRKTDDEVAAGKPGVEPQRSALSDPPTGYRKTWNTAKGSAAPRVDQQERDASAIGWLTRKFSGANDDD